MRIAIAGAGSVGRSIARELIHNGHQVLLIDRLSKAARMKDTLEQAEFLYADACEIDTLDEGRLDTCDVLVAATGDDKVNLVVSLLAKTEFGVNRVVARVNDPRNEWLFNDAWGVDVAVSSPRVLAALVEEAVTVGDLVRLMTFREGTSNLVEITLGEQTPYVGRPVRDVPLPRDAALVTILRGPRVIVPSPDDPLEVGDELLFVASRDVEEQLRQLLRPEKPRPDKT